MNLGVGEKNWVEKTANCVADKSQGRSRGYHLELIIGRQALLFKKQKKDRREDGRSGKRLSGELGLALLAYLGFCSRELDLVQELDRRAAT